MTGLAPALSPYRYLWPDADLAADPRWRRDGDLALARALPETAGELAADSRWPALFPSSICLVTAADGRRVALDKVVGASIVNRFPYVLALSFCAHELSGRHHARRGFMDVLEAGGAVAVQLVPPGPALDRVLAVIAETPETETVARLARTGLATRPALTSPSPVLADAYLVYEGRLVRPGRDLEGAPIHETPWADVGSHRVYFLEITAIQLRGDVAGGRSQIHWRSLPAWAPRLATPLAAAPAGAAPAGPRYTKGYTPHYAFPSAGTVAFDADRVVDGMAVRLLPSEAADQVEVDNDRARWPCFFPSSVGMITAWAGNGQPNLMPCGSTTVVSRHPLVISPCVSYTAINERYATRATLELIRKTGAFGCGVPFISERVVEAIQYAGNVSRAHDADKVARAGFAVAEGQDVPLLPELPVNFECRVVGERRLGTHVMFFGEVRRIVVRRDVSPENPLEWCPWPAVAPAP